MKIAQIIVLLLLSTSATAVEVNHYNVNFVSQPLELSLNLFSRVIDQTISYDPNLISEISSPQVTGYLTDTEIITALLKGSDLCAEKVNLGWLIVQCKINTATTASLKMTEKTLGKKNNYLHEEIMVTGFRNSLAKAKEIKRAAMVAQDSILAEDIADFPDLNLADSLQRIPGITITREAGEGRQISLRGLGPDFTRVMINGVEAMGMTSSPMDARGAVTRSRAFDYNIFSSELFNQIDVKKSYLANMEEGGIAGTVALYTAKPSDFKDSAYVFSYRQSYNTNSLEYDPRVSALLTKNWQNWGGLLSFSYSNRNTTEYGTNTSRWRQESKQYVGVENSTLQKQLKNAEFWFPRGHRYSLWNNKQQRLGITSSIEFSPNDSFTSSFNLFFNKLQNSLDEHHLAVKNNKLVESLQWRENNGNKEVIFANYQDATWRAETREDYNQTTFQQASFNTQFKITPSINASLLLGANRSEYEQPTLNKVNINAENVDITTDFTNDAFYGLSYSDNFDTTDHKNFSVKDLHFQENYVTTDMLTGKLDFSFAVDPNTYFYFGSSYKKLVNDGHDRVKGGFPNDATAPMNSGNLNFTDDLATLFTQHPNQQWVQADLNAIQSYYGLDNFCLNDADIIDSSNYKISEKTTAIYASLELDSHVASKPVTLSLGLRWFNTQLMSAGYSYGEYTSISRDYSDWLPTFGLVVDLDTHLLWRLGLSKNITRASISNLSFSANVSQTSREEGDIGSVWLGNPYLKPFESINIDNAFEWYFEDSGLFSFALFYKDIKNFIVEESSLQAYSSLGLPVELLQQGDSIDDLFLVATPKNEDSSTIRGFELAYSKDLSFLPAPFDQLGVSANYTWADGNTLYRDVQGTGVDQYKTFAGLSKQSYNFTLYYESASWSARVSSAYRSDYILSVTSGNTDQDESGYHDTNYIDASISFALSKNLKFKVEGLNLTNQRQELYSDSNDRAYNTTSSGRSYFIGLTGQY